MRTPWIPTLSVLTSREGKGMVVDTAPKTRIFISYSRKDAAFADQLAAALNARGYGAFLDREDISDAEPWRERLESLILQADAVAFVLSPDSLASPVCDWETRRTVELGKRLIPLRFRAFEQRPPEQLSRLNYIPIDAEETFDAGVGRLCAACDVDIAWVREHTRLVNLATRWDAGGRRDDPLLRGADLSEAEAWLARREPKAPEVPDVLLVFLQSSRNAETLALQRDRESVKRTRRLRLGIGGTTLLAFVVAIVGGIIVLELVSDFNKQRSNTLAELARVASEQGFYDRAARYALVGLQGADLPMVGYDASLAEDALRVAVEHSGAVGVLRGHDAPVTDVVFSPDGARILSVAEDGGIIIWDSRTGAEVARLRHEPPEPVGNSPNQVAVREPIRAGVSAEYARDGALIFTYSVRSPVVRLWNPDGSALAELRHDENVMSAAMNADNNRLVTTSLGATGTRTDRAYVWDLRTRTQLFTIDFPDTGIASMGQVSPDGTRILTTGLLTLWDARTGERVARLQPRERPDVVYGWDQSRSAAFTPNGDFIVSAGPDGVGHLWDGHTGRELGTLRAPSGGIDAIRFDQTGERAVTDGDGVVVWDTGNWEAITATFARRTSSSAISPRGGRMVTIDGAQALFWNITDLDQAIPPERDGDPFILRLPLSFAGHEGAIRSVAYSPDSERIATGGEDGVVRLWNASAYIRVNQSERWISNLAPRTRHELVRQACATTSTLGLSRFSAFELNAAPALDPVADADACHPGPPLSRLRLFGRAPQEATPTPQSPARN